MCCCTSDIPNAAAKNREGGHTRGTQNFDLPPSVLWLRTFQFFMGGIGVIPLHKQIKRQACISELAPCGFIRRHAVLFHQ